MLLLHQRIFFTRARVYVYIYIQHAHTLFSRLSLVSSPPLFYHFTSCSPLSSLLDKRIHKEGGGLLRFGRVVEVGVVAECNA